MEVGFSLELQKEHNETCSNQDALKGRNAYDMRFCTANSNMEGMKGEFRISFTLNI